VLYLSGEKEAEILFFGPPSPEHASSKGNRKRKKVTK
jgi:hypothetical protein